MMTILCGCDRFGAKECEEFLKKVPPSRRKKATGYRFVKDTVTSLCVYLLYRCTSDGEEEIRFDARGKPYLPSGTGLSLSHTDGAVACALSDKNVGCDVQKKFAWETPLAERILTERERERCALVPDRSEFLTEIWSLKESYGKYTGEGVFTVLQKKDFADKEKKFVSDGLFYTVGERDGIVYAVCSEKEEEVVIMNANAFLSRVRTLTEIP